MLQLDTAVPRYRSYMATYRNEYAAIRNRPKSRPTTPTKDAL
jgi:hypothetical protein